MQGMRGSGTLCQIANFSFFTLNLFSPNITVNFPSQDQNFHRATWTKSDPGCCPCLLPQGKYVVTARWTLLHAQVGGLKCLFPHCLRKGVPPELAPCVWSSSPIIMVSFGPCKEKMKLQGVGMDEYRRYGMKLLKQRHLADMIGNSSLG